MTLDQLQYFVAACDEKNLSRAAEKLFVSHSSVSRSISALEQELGVRLLARSRQSVELTEAGTHCYKRSVSILRQLSGMKRELGRFSAPGLLRVGSVSGLRRQYFSLFGDYAATVPELRLQYDYNCQWRLIGGLIHGDYDVCLAFSYRTVQIAEMYPNIDALPVDSGCFKAAVSHNHPLARAGSVSLEELKKRPDMVSGEVTDLLLSTPFDRVKFRKISSRNDFLASDIVFQVQTQNVIVVVPEHVTDAFGGDCAVLSLSDCRIDYDLVLLTRKNDAAVAGFLTYCRSRLSDARQGLT